MENIRLLDCTLRDGGYINQWDFGEKAKDGIYFPLSDRWDKTARLADSTFRVRKVLSALKDSSCSGSQ